MKNKRGPQSCYFCNHTMRLDLDAYMVLRVGGKSGVSTQSLGDMDARIVETVKVQLCTCPNCGKNERIISEEVIWLSLNEVFQAIREGRIISKNPEIELIFKILENVLRNK